MRDAFKWKYIFSIIPRWLMISYAFLYYIYIEYCTFCHTIPNFFRGLSDYHGPLWESTLLGIHHP